MEPNNTTQKRYEDSRFVIEEYTSANDGVWFILSRKHGNQTVFLSQSRTLTEAHTSRAVHADKEKDTPVTDYGLMANAMNLKEVRRALALIETNFDGLTETAKLEFALKRAALKDREARLVWTAKNRALLVRPQ